MRGLIELVSAYSMTPDPRIDRHGASPTPDELRELLGRRPVRRPAGSAADEGFRNDEDRRPSSGYSD